MKIAGATVARKLVQQGGFAAINLLTEYSLDKIREGLMQSCKRELRVAVDAVCGYQLAHLNNSMDAVYQASYEVGQAEKTIYEAMEKVLRRHVESTTGQAIGAAAKRLVFNLMVVIQEQAGGGKWALAKNAITLFQVFLRTSIDQKKILLG